MNWGKYLAYAANDSPYTSTNPGATIVRNVPNRGWNASMAAGGNGDLVVDCNLLNPDANGECAAVTGNRRNFGSAGLCDAGRSRGAERLGRASGRHPDDRHACSRSSCRACRRDFSYTHRSSTASS